MLISFTFAKLTKQNKTMGIFKSDNKSSNPTLKDSIFDKEGRATDTSNAMTIDGAIGKTGILLLLVVLGGMLTWNMFGNVSYHNMIMPLFWFGIIGGFILAMVISFKRTTAPYLAPVYAFLEGIAMGGISAILNNMYNGIAFQAICLTVLVATLMLVLYRFRVIRATERFRSIIILATASIAVFYLISFVLSFFGIYSPLSLNSTAPLWLTLGVSVVVVVIAALNLILDFDFIERGAEYGSPKYMEWYGAFGLTVTLVWLYLEILKLLARIANR